MKSNSPSQPLRPSSPGAHAAAEVTAVSRGGAFSRLRRSGSGFLFLLPALVIYCAFLIYPVLDSLVISLTNWDGLSPNRTFVGLANYQRVFQDPGAVLSLKNNAIWTLVMVVVPTLLGLLLALGLNARLPGRNLFRSLFYMPGVLPLVAIAAIWAWMYDPNLGLINTGLKAIGLEGLAQQWLGNPRTALLSVLVAAIWQGVGFPMVLYLAGLQGIPPEQHEAARVDGATPWQQFWYVTLPGLSTTHIIVITLAVINSFNAFDLIYAMTYGGPGQATQVLASWMYFQTFQYFKAGYGSAIAWVIALISLAVSIPYLRTITRRDDV